MVQIIKEIKTATYELSFLFLYTFLMLNGIILLVCAMGIIGEYGPFILHIVLKAFSDGKAEVGRTIKYYIDVWMYFIQEQCYISDNSASFIYILAKMNCSLILVLTTIFVIILSLYLIILVFIKFFENKKS